MYGGPGFGPGPGGPHGPHDCGCHHHGPHGPGFGPGYGPGPGGPWGPWGPRFYYGAPSKDNKIDYMKSLDYKGEGKKHYDACACEHCAKPFEMDYRLAKNVTFISKNELGFENGKFYSDYKFDGYFKFKIECPECSCLTTFFVETKKLPKFVLDYYLKETIEVEYTITYKLNNFYAPFKVSYQTNGTNVKEVFEKINSAYLENILYSKGKVKTSLDKINQVVEEEYHKKTGRTTKIDENSIHINNMESIPKVKKLKMLKYLLINNGIKGLANYGSQNKQAKEEIKILSR